MYLLKKICFIINPVASRMKGFSKTDLAKHFPDNEYDISIIETKYPKHATEIARGLAQKGVKTIVSVGGEGTLHEIIQGVANENVQIGIIPNAVKHTVAHQLGIPTTLSKAAAIIKSGQTKKIDLLRLDAEGIGDVYAIAFIGIGFSAFIAKKMAKNKTIATHFQYMRKMLFDIMKYKPSKFKVSYNYVNKEIQPTEFIITNSKGYNTILEYCPQASNTDGIIDVVTFEDLNKGRIAVMALKGMLGMREDLLDISEYDKTEYLTMRFETPTDIHIDFESYNVNGLVEVSIVKGGASILSP